MSTIFSSPSLREVADEVVRETGATRGSIQSNSFSDGWPDFFIEDVREKVE